MRGYHLAVDVEATCEKGNRIPFQEMEIIEIGAVMLDANLTVVDEFQTFVKPVVHPALRAFCTELTGITQKQVTAASGAQEAFKQFAAWQADYQPQAWYSWGDYDRKQFLIDCARADADWPFTGGHINGKKLFKQYTGRRASGLKSTVDLLGLTWIGRHHSGLDDARNVAQILQHILK